MLFKIIVNAKVDSGEPKGRMGTLGSVDTYIAGTSNGKHAVLFFSDAFGLKLDNNKIMADLIAENLETVVYVPDLFKGTAVSPSAINPPARPSETAKLSIFQKLSASLTFLGALPTFLPFMIRNYPTKKVALVKEVFGAIPEPAIAISGYCYGSSMFKLLLLPERSDDNRIKAGYIAHPSITSPQDIINFNKSIPLCVSFPEQDQLLNMQKMKEAESGLATNTLPSEVKFYAGVSILLQSVELTWADTVHGFAARPVADSETDMKAWQDALEHSISFFKQHLMES